MMTAPSDVDRKEYSRRGIKPWQGISLLLLLLIIPIGVYISSQQRSVADTRSSAIDYSYGESWSVGNSCQRQILTPQTTKKPGTASEICWCDHGTTITAGSPIACNCPSGGNPVVYGPLGYNDGHYKVTLVYKCRNSKILSNPLKTPTPRPASLTCNKACTTDASCGTNTSTMSWSCVSLPGRGKVCRNTSCAGSLDCNCNKVVACGKACTNTENNPQGECGIGKICFGSNNIGVCRNASCYAVENCSCYSNQSPTPTPTSVNKCNQSCAQESDCGEGKICVDINGEGKCRNTQCYLNTNCLCYGNATPTPVNRCNATCVQDSDCGDGKVCTRIASTGETRCRNVSCYTVPDCICYSSANATNDTYSQSYSQQNTARPTATPIPTSTPMPTSPPVYLSEAGTLAQPILTVDPFFDSKQQTNPLIALSGTSDPDSEISITITPDGVSSTVTADQLGNWRYVTPKKLTNGIKQLTIVSTTAKGTRKTKTQTFTVVGGFQFPYAPVIFSVLIALGVGGYILYQKKKNGKTPGIQPPETEKPA